jgi:succinate dehydrogenase / fumarate reductase cytochrome b subunit
MSTLLLTLRESARYRGRSGHWSWVAHRISGLAILAFLVIHVWETAFVTYRPEIYEYFITLFKHPLIVMSEVPLMAAVLYHAFNGVRITILDMKPELWKHQQRSATITWGLFFLIFIPIAIYMQVSFWSHCAEIGDACWNFPRWGDFVN